LASLILMSRLIRNYWPYLLSLVLLVVTMGILLWISVGENEGRFVYALDDAYIHMAIAKHLVQDGVWGVGTEHFTSSSSSMLWVLIVSFTYFVFGVGELAPYLLNLLFAAILLFVLYRFLKNELAAGSYIFVCLVLAIFFTPLPNLIVSGMEHVLHVLLTIVFVYLSTRILSTEEVSPQRLKILYVITPLLAAVRYEGLFVIFVVCCLFALRKRFRQSLILAVAGILPVVAYGLISKLLGWFWLPNSIILKGRFPNLTSVLAVVDYLDWSIPNLLRLPYPLLYLAITSLVIYAANLYRGKSFWEKNQIAIFIFLAASCLHIQFADIGWFFRYEAYLVALGMFTVSVSLYDAVKHWIGVASAARHIALPVIVSILFALFPLRSLTIRAIDALKDSTKAQNDRYVQHLSVATFLSRYYNDQTVVLNDIGAATFYSDARVLDMYGISNVEPINFRQAKDGYTSSDVFQWASQQHAKIAVLQVQWHEISSRIPIEWTPVRVWEIPRNVVFPDRLIGFFAIDSAELGPLTRHLSEFSSTLPRQILQREGSVRW
jgi:hypothetical protein